MTTITLRELGEILTHSKESYKPNLLQYENEVDKGTRYVYKIQSATGGNPSNGMFTINEPSLETTTLIEVSTNDFYGTSTISPNASLPGNIVILTRRNDIYTKAIFKITARFQVYGYDARLTAHTLTVAYITGSKYNPSESYEDFYIEFGRMD